MATLTTVDIAQEDAQTKVNWAPVAWFGALLVICYAPILYRMGMQWATDDNMSHGFFVPLFAAFVAWKKRSELSRTPTETNWLGLVVVIGAGLLSMAATLGAELFTARLSFVIAVFGTVLFLCGTKWVKTLAFPLFLLLFMVPIPAIIYSALTLRLQMLASHLGEIMISAMGIPVLRQGNTLQLPHQTLDIVDACSGIRSLLSLLFLSLVYSYWTDNRIWIRWALLAATVPIAIGANGFRVALTGLVSQIDPKFATGGYHEAEGYIVFVVALVALVLTHKVLSIAAKRFGSRNLASA